MFLFIIVQSSLRGRVIIQTASAQTVPKATGQRKIGGRFSVNDVVMWVRDSSSSGHCTVARAQPDHREGGLRFFPQPSITHTHISKDRYKQTRPDAHLCTSPLCVIYTYFLQESHTVKRSCNLHWKLHKLHCNLCCVLFMPNQALTDAMLFLND